MNTAVIIGCGFVGATAYQAFSQIPGWEIYAYDKFADNCKLKQETPNAKFISWEETKHMQLALICLPTPMDKVTGECDTSLIENMVRDIRAREGRGQTEIVIKSTVPPGTTKRLNEKYSSHNGGLFFNPEFLTEANAYNDFVDLQYQIIGSPTEERSHFLSKLYTDGLNSVRKDSRLPVILGGRQIIQCDSTMAEMVKLTRNCYLATRLSFFNEIKEICDSLDVNYNEMRPLVGLDSRVGWHYNQVSDENPGWGLSCLPKDINDLMFEAQVLGVDPKVMRAAWEKNLEVRKFRDWEQMEKAVKKH